MAKRVKRGGEVEEPESPRQLPTFKGYTVDFRLQEFRRARHPEPIEFIPFDSPKGRRLLAELYGSNGGD